MSDNGVPEPHGDAPSDYLTDVLAAKALHFLDNAPAGDPIFLMVSPTSTHGPFVPAPRHVGVYADAPAPLPPNFNEPAVSDKPAWVQQLTGVNESLWTTSKRSQWEAALGIDQTLAAIEARLAAQNRLDDTVVVFASDNGLSQGSHRWGTKRCPYTECMTVPLTVRFPGVGGRTETRLASNTDLMPTFLDLAGATPLAPQDGVSQVPVLEDPTRAAQVRTSILGHWTGGTDRGDYDPDRKPVPGYYSLRTPQWRYIEIGNLAVPGGIEYELYRIRADRWELTNVAGDPANRRIVRALHRQLEAAVLASGGQPGPQGDWEPGLLEGPAGLLWVDLG